MPFNLVCPSSRGLSLALSRALLTTSPLPLVATARRDLDDVKARILRGLNVSEDRLHIFKVDVTDEDTLSSAAENIKSHFPNDYINWLFSTPGVLYPERSPTDLRKDHIIETLHTNLLGPMLIMKHFSPFLPGKKDRVSKPSIWANMAARVGSIEDNRLGGWYSYRSTKAGVNQVTKSFDNHLKIHSGDNCFAVSLHPGTVKTELSKEFWDHTSPFDPEDSAKNLLNVVGGLGLKNRGLFYDWKGDRVPW
ncbi:hypothetical protein EDC01DRAFT_629458 [Geopyxis carbonaria]|nr:hypothetical protein EDC01DRAFT_629458 [Geopyxis carbonaria]